MPALKHTHTFNSSSGLRDGAGRRLRMEEHIEIAISICRIANLNLIASARKRCYSAPFGRNIALPIMEAEGMKWMNKHPVHYCRRYVKRRSAAQLR